MSKIRSKPRTLDSTWELCLEMWKYVASVCAELGNFDIGIPYGFVDPLKKMAEDEWI